MGVQYGSFQNIRGSLLSLLFWSLNEGSERLQSLLGAPDSWKLPRYPRHPLAPKALSDQASCADGPKTRRFRDPKASFPSPLRTYYLGTGALQSREGPTIYSLGTWGARDYRDTWYV